jgi:two-component system sensor histidine kinase RegB
MRMGRVAGGSARMSVLASAPVVDAGRRNMALLVQLRWLAVGGQLATIIAVHWGLDVPLPLIPLIAALGWLVAINLVTLAVLRRRQTVSQPELFGVLLFDVAALTWQLQFTGGLANPFASLFLLQVVIGAMILRPASSWALVAATLIALGVLTIDAVPLALPAPYADDPLMLYLTGSFVCFVLIAVLLTAFVTRIARNLRQRDAALAAIRQRAAEEDHIVRMGLLASGAAHELGTPLATLSVLLGDLRSMPRLTEEHEIRDDLDDMEAAVQRCKAIVSGILMSAGEARGEAVERTTVHAFLAGIITDWQGTRGLERLDFDNRFGPDMAILADPALRQVIGTVIDNAAEVSPQWVGMEAARDGDSLVLTVRDRGPGFPSDMIEGFGRPYRSTKDRPGAGLGLFLLVNVVRKLGGEASGENPPTGGAKVTIRLPLAALAPPEREMSR